MADPGLGRRLRPDLHVLGVSVGITVLSMILTPSDSVLELFGWPVPPLCLFKALLDIECWGCGLTRSFTFMGHGDLDAAFAMHKLGPLLFGLVAAQIPYRAARVLRLLRAPPPPAQPPPPTGPPPPPAADLHSSGAAPRFG